MAGAAGAVIGCAVPSADVEGVVARVAGVAVAAGATVEVGTVPAGAGVAGVVAVVGATVEVGTVPAGATDEEAGADVAGFASPAGAGAGAGGATGFFAATHWS